MSHPLRDAIAMTAAAAAISACLYAKWFHECCLEAGRDIVAFAFFPAMGVQIILSGGDVHGGSPYSPYQFAAGVAVELYLLLWLFRGIRSRLQRGKSASKA